MSESRERLATVPKTVEPEEEAEEHGEAAEGFSGPWYRFPPIRGAALAGVLLAAGYAGGRLGLTFPAQIALYLAAIGLGGRFWAREGWEEFIEEREIGIEALMAAATVGAIALGEWSEAAFLVFLYAMAEGLEEYTYARTRTAIRALLDLAPKEARLLENGQERLVPAASLKRGDLFAVRPGESLATDGEIRSGRSSINEAAITGESLPVEKAEGDHVFAGTLNNNGALTIEATAGFEDNTLSKIIHLVEKAQAQKGRAQQFIDRFGRRYSPAVLLAAILLLAVPALLGLDWWVWATRAVVLLVAAAPCALVMSTPVAVAAGIGAGGRNGVLIKGGISLERLGAITAIAMDKTGTITSGQPVVGAIVPLGGGADADVLALAAAVERASEHPLAQAVMRKAQELRLAVPNADDFTALPGAGARARVGDAVVFVGNPDLFSGFGLAQAPEVSRQIAALQEQGHTVILVGTQEEVRGLIAIRDQVRPEAVKAIRELRQVGVRHIVMLTGDNERTARAIAREVGIDEVRAEMKPEDKARVVQELAAEHGGVIMIGDGINDAPALAAATVGIAMGTAGTDAAIEAADVALMGDDLYKVALALRLGRRARAISRQNIVFSLLLLAVLVPLAVGGFLGVAVAVLAHESSELLAVGNGLRARSV